MTFVPNTIPLKCTRSLAHSAHLGVGGKYLVIAVIETAKPLIAPSLSKVTELLMKRIVEANAADTNTMKTNFIVHKDIHSNHELCVCVGVCGGGGWGGGDCHE